MVPCSRSLYVGVMLPQRRLQNTCCQQVFWSRLWGNVAPTYRDREQGTIGETLEVNPDFLTTATTRHDPRSSRHVSSYAPPLYQRRRQQDDELPTGSTGPARSPLSGRTLARILTGSSIWAACWRRTWRITDTTGHWVAHRLLAELVVAAEDRKEHPVDVPEGETTTQSAGRHRWRSSRACSLDSTAGDRTSWRFLRLVDARLRTEHLGTTSGRDGHIGTAGTRHLAAPVSGWPPRNTKEVNQEWLEVADEKWRQTWDSQVHTRLARLRGRPAGQDQVDQPDHEDDPLSTANHVKHFGAMADLLNRVAPANDIPGTKTSASS